jgi:hypothetical protein
MLQGKPGLRVHINWGNACFWWPFPLPFRIQKVTKEEKVRQRSSMDPPIVDTAKRKLTPT